jgi:predicted deacylase
LPVVVVRGERPGPTIWLSAALHGDELNGVVIVDEIVRRIDPRTLAGTVLAVPLVNAFGLIQGSRYLPDRRDLNRCFPGSKRGSLGARLAHLLSETVIARSDLGIDFHTGSAGRVNLPQVRCDLSDPRVQELAVVFGAKVALHAGLRDGSLRSHAVKLGKPTLLYEGGEANRLDDMAIEAGIAGALRVMNHAGMLPGTTPPPAETTQMYKASTWIRAHRSGLCRLAIGLGARVEPGLNVGKIVDPSLGTRTSVRIKTEGVVIGRATNGLVTAGDALLHVATTEM